MLFKNIKKIATWGTRFPWLARAFHVVVPSGAVLGEV